MKSLNYSLTVFFMDMYLDSKKQGNTCIPTISVAKKVILPLYDSFIDEGAMVAIESLTEEEKINLVNECREVKNVIYTNETLILTAKILHVLKTISTTT